MNFEFVLPPLAKRAVAVLLALVPVALIAAMLVSYGSDVLLHRQRVAQLERERASYAALAANADAWKQRAARLRTATAGGFVFTNPKVDAAAQDLVTQASTIVTTEGGGNLQSRPEISAGGEDGATEIRANLSFTADIGKLTHILYRLRQARPLMLPEHLSVRSSASGPLTAPNALQIEMAVVGYVQVP